MSREDVLAWLSKQGFHAGTHFDFLYVQMDLEGKMGAGQAIVNMCSMACAECLLQNLQGFQDWSCGDVLEVLWNAEQGYSRLVERFRNSRVMHRAVDDSCK